MTLGTVDVESQFDMRGKICKFSSSRKIYPSAFCLRSQQYHGTLWNRSSESLESRVNKNLEQLQQDCFWLENMARKEVPTRRQNAKFMVEQLSADIKVIQNAYRSRQQRKSQVEQAASEMEELLSRRYTPNAPAMDTSITIDAELQQHNKLQHANRAMDNLFGSASSIFGSITTQGGTLKGAHRRMLDVINTLGLSNTVMRLIEKRSAQDRVIFFGGVIVSLIIMYIVIRYAL